MFLQNIYEHPPCKAFVQTDRQTNIGGHVIDGHYQHIIKAIFTKIFRTTPVQSIRTDRQTDKSS